MRKGGLLNGAYWFYMYTTFFAILSLVYYVLGNPKSPDSEGFLNDAIEGKDSLKALAKTSLAADRCTQTLAGLFKELPGRVRRLRAQPESKKKRVAMSPAYRTHEEPNQQGSFGSTSNAYLKKDATLVPKGQGREGSVGWTSRRESISSQRKQSTPQEVSRSRPNLATDPIDFNSRSSVQLTSGAQSIRGFQQQVPNFSVMTFPSNDPFTYPNPPMATLESHQTREPYSASSIPPLSDQNQPHTRSFNPSFDDFDPQSFGALPPYLMQAQQPGMAYQDMTPRYDWSETLAVSEPQDIVSMRPESTKQGQTPQSTSFLEPDHDPNQVVAGNYQPWTGQGYQGPR